MTETDTSVTKGNNKRRNVVVSRESVQPESDAVEADAEGDSEFEKEFRSYVAPPLRPGQEIAKNTRRYRMELPPAARVSPTDPKTVVMRELTDEDLDVAKKLMSKNSSGANSQASEVVKYAIVEVDGKPIDHMADEMSFLWSRWSQRVKTLLSSAWATIHVPPAEETESFLASLTLV